MALGTEEATFNGLVDDLIDGWVTVVAALASAEKTRIVFCNPRGGGNAADERLGSAAEIKAAFDATQWVIEHINTPDATTDVPLSMNGHPLFFKITNAAGDLS